MVEAVKKAAMQAVEASKPSGVYFGTVISASPLKINVEQKMILGSKQLILTRNVTDYAVEMTVDHYTQNETEHAHAVHDTYTNGGSSDPTIHLHAYKGTKVFTVHNGLVNGEKVILLRVPGGQKYVVWDRIL
jgi:hypothetical protein